MQRNSWYLPIFAGSGNPFSPICILILASTFNLSLCIRLNRYLKLSINMWFCWISVSFRYWLYRTRNFISFFDKRNKMINNDDLIRINLVTNIKCSICDSWSNSIDIRVCNPFVYVQYMYVDVHFFRCKIEL